MSDFQEQPWSNNPNAPDIPYRAYILEKGYFAGVLIGSILYGTHKRSPPRHVRLSVLTPFVRFILGVLIVLFFNCMVALFKPANRRGQGIKWGLASYTVVMFSLVTVLTGIKGHILSISYIDNRNFDGGPDHYESAMAYKAMFVIPRAAQRLNNWLADGLLVGSLPVSAVTLPVPNADSSFSSTAVTYSTP